MKTSAKLSPDAPLVEQPLPRLEVESLSVHYGDRCALRDIAIPIHDRAITAIVGPSGCGKSTFLQSLNRLTDLVPGCRLSGHIRFEGKDITSSGTDLLRLRRKIGMIFQKPNPLPLTIRRNFSLPLREHGLRDRREIEAKLERALRGVGLWDEVKDRLDTLAPTLSGGQQQRLCIARALALDPEVILLDEPCSSLDPLSSAVVEELIETLRDRYTVVVVTHNLAQARRIAEHTALFWVVDGAGCLIEAAPTHRFFTAPENPLTRAYVSGTRG